MLAAWVLGVVGLIYVAIFACYLSGVMSDAKLTAAVAALSAPQALAAAAMGFYYNNSGKKKDKST